MTIYYKAFNKDKTCRGVKFTEGEVHTVEGKPIICEHGFHFCKDLVLTLQYYTVANDINENLYAEVEVVGDVVFEDSTQHKGCTNALKVLRFLSQEEVRAVVDKSLNSGNYNSGDYNSGNRNSGDWNQCDRETGYLNTIGPEYIRVFNKAITIEEWNRAKIPSFFYFKQKEGETYKEAWARSYAEASNEDKALVRALPNFDADVFYELSGIDLRE